MVKMDADKGGNSDSRFKTKAKVKVKVSTDRHTISANWENFLAHQPPHPPHNGHKDTTKPRNHKQANNNNHNAAMDIEKQTETITINGNTNSSAKKRRKKKTNAQNSQNSTPEHACTKLDETVDNTRIEQTNDEKPVQNNETHKLPPNNKGPTMTRYVGMDCEMVGVGPGGKESILARASLVNGFGDCIYDKFVKPREKVTDYRTPVSGVREADLVNGERFDVVQKEVAEILRGRYLVGHSLKHDMEVLFLTHPRSKIRDTSGYKPFRAMNNGKTPSLQLLAKTILNVDIQKSEHDSVEDARVAMQLYQTNSKTWEAKLHAQRRDRKIYRQKVQTVTQKMNAAIANNF